MGSNAVARCGNILVLLHAEGPGGPIVAEMHDHVREMHVASPHGVGILLLLKQGARPPEGAARTTLQNLMRDLGEALRMGVVMEGSGFWAAATRSTLTFLSMMGSRGGAAIKVFSESAEAIEWLTSQLGARGALFTNGQAVSDTVRRLRG